ncbi:MAG: substrate-binding domain-containing protein [Nitrospirota bacterium]
MEDIYKMYKKYQEQGLSRRDFMKAALATGLASTVVMMEPLPYKKGTYAAEMKLSPEYWEIASRYGEPQAKFGKVGEPVTITIGYQPYCLQCQTANINKQAKLWMKHFPKGSKVEWFRSLSGPLINNNMLAEKNMFGYMCDTPGLRAMDTVPVVTGCTGGYDTGEHGAMVVRKDLWDSGKVKSPKDLDGSKIGVPLGSFSHRQALDIIDEFKIKPRLLDQSTELQVTHMRAKNIDACVTWEPYPSYIEYLGIGHRLITGLEMKCTCSKYYPVKVPHNWTTMNTTLMIFTWLRDRPDIMVAYLKAEEEARDMWVNDIDLAAYHSWSDIPEFPQSVVRMTMEMNTPDGRVTANTKEHLKGIARQWRSIKVLTSEKSKDPDKFIDDWIDDRFYKLALKELKAQGLWTSEKLPGFPVKHRPGQDKRHNLKDFANVKLKPKEWMPTKAKWPA